MFFRSSVIILLVAALFIKAEESVSCDKTAAYNSIRNMRKAMQIARATNETEAFYLYNVLKGFEDVSEVIKSIVHHCPENDQKQIKALLRLVSGFIFEDTETPSLDLIEDQKLLEEFVGLLYSIDNNLIATVMIKATPEISLPVSNAFINLLDRTNLNNTEVIPTIKLMSRVNDELKTTEDQKASGNLKNILMHAIKADLILQHNNIEELYEINKELTKAVLKEQVTNYAFQKIESYEQLALFPLFLIIKCASNYDIWIDNLNLVFEALKSNDKLNSIQTLMLLKEVNGLLIHVPENEVLLNIKSQIPNSMEKVLYGNICAQSEEIIKPKNVFIITSNGFRVMNFQPNEQGTNTLITASAGKFNFTIVLNSTEGLPDFTKLHTVQKHVGDLEKITEREFCNKKEDIALHGCVPLEKVLPTGGDKVLHLGLVKQMASYIDLVFLETFSKNLCGKV